MEFIARGKRCNLNYVVEGNRLVCHVFKEGKRSFSFSAESLDAAKRKIISTIYFLNEEPDIRFICNPLVCIK